MAGAVAALKVATTVGTVSRWHAHARRLTRLAAGFGFTSRPTEKLHDGPTLETTRRRASLRAQPVSRWVRIAQRIN